MRVLTTGRVLLAPALLAASVAAGARAARLRRCDGRAQHGRVHAGGTAATVVVRSGHAPGAGATTATAGVDLGPAVKYVREPDGTVRQVR